MSLRVYIEHSQSTNHKPNTRGMGQWRINRTKQNQIKHHFQISIIIISFFYPPKTKHFFIIKHHHFTKISSYPWTRITFWELICILLASTRRRSTHFPCISVLILLPTRFDYFHKRCVSVKCLKIE